MVKKAASTKKRSKTSKSNVKPKVPGGGWTSGMTTAAAAQSTEVDIDELLKSTDDSGVKEIIDEFQRLHDDDPLTSRMKQIIKFPDQFVENMETLLNNKAFNTVQPLFRILRGWKDHINSGKKCQDIFSVGIGCASGFTHMVGELGIDAIHSSKLNHVEGIKVAPSPEEMKMVSLIASTALNEKINKLNNSTRYRLTIENDIDILVDVMGKFYPEYRKEYASKKTA